MSSSAPSYSERVRRLEDAKQTEEREQRPKGRGVFTGSSVSEPATLDDALQQLVHHMVPCRVCVVRGGGRPATHRVFNTAETRAGRQTAEVVICDHCEPPQRNAFAFYSWGPPYDLPYAGALRVLLRQLPPIVLPDDEAI